MAPSERVVGREHSTMEQEGRNVDPNATNAKQRQYVTFPLSGNILTCLTRELRSRVSHDSNLDAFFGDFVLYAACKNTKLEFMPYANRNLTCAPSACFTTTATRFLSRWESHFDAEHIDPERVFVDVGKQTTAVDTSLCYEAQPRKDFQPETFLYRTCCLASIYQRRLDWLSAFDIAGDNGLRERPKRNVARAMATGTPMTSADFLFRFLKRQNTSNEDGGGNEGDEGNEGGRSDKGGRGNEGGRSGGGNKGGRGDKGGGDDEGSRCNEDGGDNDVRQRILKPLLGL